MAPLAVASHVFGARKIGPRRKARPMKPDNFTLPWCDTLNLPYWQISFTLCGTMNGWRELQSGLKMEQIIPLIDRMIEVGALRRLAPGEPNRALLDDAEPPYKRFL